ncbi:MAG: hypothetical protein B7Y45_13030 [Sphingomonas sp. 28-66-16]|nr:MAG: hypothetical protein B7Y45_13030 [Sphingomonas sp. 28-66-16]
MRLALSLALAAPLAAAVATVAYAAQPIAVGAHVPANFAAVDSAGKPRSFASIAGKKGVVLIFFRSAKWCPYCQAQLKDIRALPAQLAHRGYTLAAISYDAPESLASFADRQQVNYTLLSDGGSKMIDAFGLRDPQYPKDSFAYGVPKATVLVIGNDGVIKRKLTTEDYKIRPSNDKILAAVDAG